MRALLATLALLAACGNEPSAAPAPAPTPDQSVEAVAVAKSAKPEAVDTSGWKHMTLRVLGMT